MDSQSPHPENIFVLQVLEGGEASIELWMETSTHAVVLLPEKYCSCAYQAFGASEWSICVG